MGASPDDGDRSGEIMHGMQPCSTSSDGASSEGDGSEGDDP